MAVVLAAGCAGRPAPVGPKTGAEEVAQAYFEALAHKNWAAAYQALDADSRSRCSREAFARLAENYRRNLGFEPDEVRVQGCDERGDEAVAHVTHRGTAGPSERYFKDGVGLRRGGDGWAVVLPRGFGMVRPRRG
jgi:hypothetical protein